MDEGIALPHITDDQLSQLIQFWMQGKHIPHATQGALLGELTRQNTTITRQAMLLQKLAGRIAELEGRELGRGAYG